MTTRAISTILKKRAAQAGVKAFSPHDFLRTLVGDLLENGADIATVAKLAGHASLTTTARYDRLAALPVLKMFFVCGLSFQR